MFKYSSYGNFNLILLLFCISLYHSSGYLHQQGKYAIKRCLVNQYLFCTGSAVVITRASLLPVLSLRYLIDDI